MEQVVLSPKWQKKFVSIAKINGSFSRINELKFGDRFNFLAFIFGPFYYFFKGMPQKGFTLIAATYFYSVNLTLFEHAIGITIPASAYAVPTSAICGIYANLDYYRLIIHNEKMWEIFPKKLESTLASALAALLAVTIFMVTLYNFGEFDEIESNTSTTEISN